MRRIVSTVLTVMIVTSLLTFVANAQEFISKTANAVAPIIDGNISEGEYVGAMEVSFDADSAKYYAYNAAKTQCLVFDKESITSRGSKILGDDTKIYTLITSDGFYFAFDVRDTTYGSNYVKDFSAHESLLIGDTVHVSIRKDNSAGNNNMYSKGDAVRVSVAPFVEDYMATTTCNRTIKIMSAITQNIGYDENIVIPLYDGRERRVQDRDILGMDGYYAHACSSDSEGYVVELFVSWKLLEFMDFTGPISYADGEKIFLNFQITDAMGKKENGKDIDWGFFQVPINSEYVITKTNVKVGDSNGCLIEGGTNWVGFKAGTADCIVMSTNQENTDTDTKTETETNKSVETKYVYTESVKESDTESKNSVISSNTEKEFEDINTNSETIDKQSKTETLKDKNSEKDSEKKEADNTTNLNVIGEVPLITIGIIAIGGTVTFVAFERKRRK